MLNGTFYLNMRFCFDRFENDAFNFWKYNVESRFDNFVQTKKSNPSFPTLLKWLKRFQSQLTNR